MNSHSLKTAAGLAATLALAYTGASWYAGRLAQNPLTPWPELYVAKAASYRRRWPWLHCIDAAEAVEAALAAPAP